MLRKALRKYKPAFFAAIGQALSATDTKQHAIRSILHDEYTAQLRLARFVSSRGLLHSCDIHVPDPVSSTTALPSLSSLAGNSSSRPASIYVCSSALREFAQAVSGMARRPFTLVTGDSDTAVGAADNREACNEILSHPDLVAWYSQNLALSHPKLFHLPIGLDFHSAWSTPSHYGAEESPFPLHQEAKLLEVAQRAAPIQDRKPRCYSDWHFYLERGDRIAAYEGIPAESIEYAESRVPRLRTWQAAAEHAFVASPTGAGYDCHRTWEALVLGSIPIVSRSPIVAVFEGLPVVVVDSWRTLTPEHLQSVIDDYAEKKFDWSRLFARYWVSAIGGAEKCSLPEMTIDEFRTVYL